MLSLHIIDVFTGDRIHDITPYVVSAPWALELNGPSFRGGGDAAESVVLNVRNADAPQLTREQWLDLIQPRARAVVWSYQDPSDPDSFPIAVDGKQIIRWEWSFTGELTIHTRDVRMALAERYLQQNGLYDPSAKANLTGQTLYSLARWLILTGMQYGTPGDGWWTPIMFFTGDESGSRNRPWPHSEWSTIEDLLKQTQEWEGGPDVFFEPFWLNTTEFRWNVRIGQPGRLDMGTMEVFPGAAVTPVRDLRLHVSAEKQITRAWMLGDGRGEERPVGYAGPISGSSIPESHGVFSSSAKTVAELNQQAAAKRNAHREATRLFTFDLEGPGMPALVNPGMTIRVNLPGDELTEPGPVDLYAVAFSGDMTDRVKVRVL